MLFIDRIGGRGKGVGGGMGCWGWVGEGVEEGVGYR